MGVPSWRRSTAPAEAWRRGGVIGPSSAREPSSGSHRQAMVACCDNGDGPAAASRGLRFSGEVSMLRDCPNGSYRYLPGIPAFSSGVVATPGWEIVHATLRAPVPWREGFARVERHLREQGRPRTALCGIELRSPVPFTFEGFDAFNEGYRGLLKEW